MVTDTIHVVTDAFLLSPIRIGARVARQERARVLADGAEQRERARVVVVEREPSVWVFSAKRQFRTAFANRFAAQFKTLIP